MAAIKTANIVLAFLLELAMLATLSYWGFNSSENPEIRWGLGITIPLAAAVLWGVLLAPRAQKRLKPVPGLFLSLALFCLAAAALFEAQQPAAAAAFALLSLANRGLMFFWKQW